MVKKMQSGQRERLHEVIAANSKCPASHDHEGGTCQPPCHAKLLGFFVRVGHSLPPLRGRSVHAEASQHLIEPLAHLAHVL